jgi:ribosomal protein L37AE/L43A
MIFLAIVIGVAVGFVLLVALVAIGMRFAFNRRRKIPARKPLECPACGSEELDSLSSGLWDGPQDEHGKRAHGVFDYALCRKCRSRVVQYHEGQAYVPSDEEWNARMALLNRHSDELARWPFAAEAED